MFKLPAILKLPNYSRLYYAGFFSELGSFVTETALMLFVFHLSGKDKSWLGITRASFLLFLTLGSILGGPFGQKFNRRNLLIASNILRVPAIAVLFFASSLYTVVGMNALIAFFTGIYNPSRQAMVNELVPQKQIKEANSLFGSTMAILHLVGPFLGATLFAKLGGIQEILSFDLFTYALGIFLLYRISYTPPQKTEEVQESFFVQLKEGFGLILKREDLRTMMINAFFAGLIVGVLVPLLLPFATETLHQGETAYGVLLSAFGLGGFVGGILCRHLSERFETGKIIAGGICLEPFIMSLWINTHYFPLNLAIFFLWGLLVFIRIPAQLNYLSETVETNFLTRTHSLLDMSFVIPNISGGIIIGFIGNRFSTMSILSVLSILFFLFIIPRAYTQGMRNLFHSRAQKVTREEINADKLHE